MSTLRSSKNIIPNTLNEIKLSRSKKIKEKKYQIALSSIKGIGGILFRRLINRFRLAENVFNAKFSELCQVPGVNTSLAKQILKYEN